MNLRPEFPPGLREIFAGEFVKKLFFVSLMSILLSGCSSFAPLVWSLPTPTAMGQNGSVSSTPSPIPTTGPASPSLTPDAQTSIQEWEKAPVVPDLLSQEVIDLYKKGQEMGNNPHAFSVIGDCDSTPSWFLGDFDRGLLYYSLGGYSDLTDVISTFTGSFEHVNITVKRGFNTAAILSPLWADPKTCSPGESPLECEIQTNHPAFAFILLGTNDVYSLDSFKRNMKAIINELEGHGIIPILATKADDLEGGNRINAIISELAREYEIPLWNFWRAVQPLPDHGLQSDGAHLTWANNRFDDPTAMEKAWPWRNLTALQVLDFVWRGVQKP